MLGKLSGKEETDGSLDLAGRKSGLLVVTGKTAGLKGKSLEDVVDERVQDRHTSLGDTGVRVNLLQHLVDVRRVGLDTLLVLLGAIHSCTSCVGLHAWSCPAPAPVLVPARPGMCA